MSIEIYNVLGQKVRLLVDREESAGSYNVTWDSTDAPGEPVATGVYLYRFQTGDYVYEEDATVEVGGPFQSRMLSIAMLRMVVITTMLASMTIVSLRPRYLISITNDVMQIEVEVSEKAMPAPRGK